MSSKEFLNYLKRIPEKDAIQILDIMNSEAERMALKLINNENNSEVKL